MRLGVGLALTDFGSQGGVSDAADGPTLVRSGLISEWKFAEGSGTTTADSFGSNTINLNTPTTPNYSWVTTGIDLAAGLVQTPSITSCRTVALLYKTTRAQTAGLIISGGPSGSGSGVLEESVSISYTHHIAFGTGVRPLRFRASNGTFAYALNRGGWVLAFCEFNTASSTILGLGGRHSTTTSRCANISLGAAWAWNKQLSSDERTQMFNYAAALLKGRGKYLKTADCPTQADCVLLWGQSNAEGRALLTGLTVPERTYASTKTYIEAQNVATRGTPPTALLTMGANQTITSPSTQFGPEYGIAISRDAAGGRDLYISKTAAGSTYLAPSSVGAPVTASTTWAPAEVETSSLEAFALQRDWFDVEQRMILDGVGPNLRALFWMQGEQDATTTVAAPDSATYQGYIQALYNDVKTYTLNTTLPMVVGRIRDVDPSMNATAKAAVRAGQAAFVSANSGCVLIDTDDLTLNADNVHYDAAGMKTLGQRFYNAVTWTP